MSERTPEPTPADRTERPVGNAGPAAPVPPAFEAGVGPDAGQDFSRLTPRDLYLRALGRFGPREALACDGRSLTYAELDAASARLASALAARGIGHGDAVALLLVNSLEFMIADIAIARLGAVKVPLNDMLAPADVAYMLGHAGARAVVAHDGFAALVAGERTAFDAVAVRIAVDGPDAPPDAPPDTPPGAPSGGAAGRDAAPGLPGFERWAAVLDAADPVAPPRPPLAPDDPGLVIYTGGTTGRPKGVVHVQEALAVNLLSQALNGEIGPDERLLLCSPLPHSAQLLAEAALVRGARVTIQRGFDAAAVLEAIERERITWTFAVPTMIYRLLDAPAREARDCSSLRTVLYGASPITESRLNEALVAFGPVFLQIYGQTEVPNFITTLAKSDHLEPEYLRSCGQPVAFCDVAIRDPGGARVPDGEVGEVTVRSPYALARYHDDPERTAEAFHGDWLRTGDVGRLGPGGHLYLVDRAKDMIVSGGMNVYSSEVEHAVQAHPDVAQVMVVGVPDDDWGEAVRAFVVPRADAAFDEGALLAHCRERLARYKVPKRVERLDALPLTAYGKPDKKALRARFWPAGGRAVN